MPHKHPSSASHKGKISGKSAGRSKSTARSELAPTSSLSDLEFDVISVLYHKAKALESYEKYLSDADTSPDIREVLEKIREEDAEHVRMLRGCIGDLDMSSGSESEEEIHA